MALSNNLYLNVLPIDLLLNGLHLINGFSIKYGIYTIDYDVIPIKKELVIL